MDRDTVKTSTRKHLTPSTKEFLCIFCGEKIENSHYRLKLFNKVKTSHCLLLEKLMNITVPTTHFTDHICRTCARKLSHVENKLNKLKGKFLSTQQKLESSHGKTSKKRLLNQSEAGSKNTLFPTEKISQDDSKRDDGLTFETFLHKVGLIFFSIFKVGPY